MQKINFFDNMNQYWDNLETQIKHTDFSMKQTDYKVLKMFMIERMLPEYSTICLSQMVDQITKMVYYEKLKKNATRNFLKWVHKQLDKDSDLCKQIKEKKQQIIEVDEQIRDAESRLAKGRAPEQITKYSRR